MIDEIQVEIDAKIEASQVQESRKRKQVRLI
jgi:hypothetical protein